MLTLFRYRSLFVKNSVCVNGVSLTIAEIITNEEDANKHNLSKEQFPCFRISMLPHTVKSTTFFDIITDMIGTSMKLYNKNSVFPRFVNIEYAVNFSPISEPLDAKTTETYNVKEAKPQTTNTDSFYMSEAFEESLKGRYSAPPNPWVGCVIVDKQGTIVGRGYHKRPGQPHAEREALFDFDKQRREDCLLSECTMFVTLEPCHHHGRTPPCDVEIVKRGIKRVVVATLDPDERVSGKGVEYLRSNGVEVNVLSDDEPIRQKILWSFRSYIYHRKFRLPWCVVKAGLSLDGFVCDANGDSKWITCEASRKDAHFLRAESQCILVGSQTAKLDKPSLNVRLDEIKSFPIRAVLDTHLQVPLEGPLFDKEVGGQTIIFCSQFALDSATTFSKALYHLKNVTLVGVPSLTNDKPNHVNLLQVLHYLANEKGVLQVLIEGGPRLHASFLDSPFVTEVVLYRSPKLLGSGKKSIVWSKYLQTTNVDQEPRFVAKESRLLNQDIVETFFANGVPRVITKFAQVSNVITSFAKGEYVLVMDDENRENEGDLLARADMMTPEKMTFLLRHSTGIVCAAMTEERAEQLQLSLQVPRDKNNDNFGTAFTVTCDGLQTGTGVSSKDRTETLLTLSNGTAEDIRKPGHIFPLIARAGLLAQRNGHTEASVSICKMARLLNMGDVKGDVAVLSELQDHQTGEMMRYKQCEAFAKEHGIIMTTVEDLKEVFMLLTNKGTQQTTNVRNSVPFKGYNSAKALFTGSAFKVFAES